VKTANEMLGCEQLMLEIADIASYVAEAPKQLVQKEVKNFPLDRVLALNGGTFEQLQSASSTFEDRVPVCPSKLYFILL